MQHQDLPSLKTVNTAAEPPPDPLLFGLPISTWYKASIILGLIVALTLPFVAKNFVIFQMTLAIVYAIAILGLNLLTGFNGQFSLGHSAFYGLGAYTAAILMEHGGMEFYWTIPIAAVVCFVFGYLFGLPALRLDSIYLALATFALAIATPQILKLSFFEHWTGGVQGIVLIKPDAPFGLPLSSDQWFYLLSLTIAIALTACAVFLVNSRTGRAMRAIRDNPIAARSMGINISLYKTLTFGVSAMYTGIAGALGAVAVAFVAPDSFTFGLAVTLFVGLVVGGVGLIPGALFGGLFAVFAPNIAEHISKNLAQAVYGIILLFVIYVMPFGLAGLIKIVAYRLALRKQKSG
ncbi:high-affinity branched-chain amino acid transport system permease protein LivH [Variibacter gotjawalensis]|uniref:High-affinity branched-chain amino acid transport system permease protein LivH n=1 Tax=Variibacter gotjawalensis TaxID=1333996 RepID=A0A0S3PPI2_9BRAD|nr:branched-chain amino acid ABC transporter permease [Variibacter gotjawalensis]NIK48148.1 branched-chain amino acid transport system permease protein [Variibacter gotjawalensis]RZS50022.1 amino acid/amide ABC transporter membrane protein 2 (HAAT family) [Variibacter gotjawalensis]BAT57851.1 high-affinity branched-chain amino acid transport system permease protein LivH [Variibacter gotjawalensis]